MNREIKFRGKTKSFKEEDYEYEGEWKYGFFYSDSKGVCYILEDSKTGRVYPGSEVIPESVGQYTGLKDKNGKEIYEGDRIRYSNSMEHGEGVIGFSAGFIIEWDLSTVKTDHPMIMQPLFYFQCSAEIEVIGNLHEKGDNNE